MGKSFFIGPVNQNSQPKGGDQFKNRILYHIIRCFNTKISLVDTSSCFGRLLILWVVLLDKLGKIDLLVVSASSLSSYKFFRIINKKTKSRTIYFVIGGGLPEIIRNKNLNPLIYKSLKAIIVQGVFLQNKLAPLGIKSFVLPNFKYKIGNFNAFRKINLSEKLKLVFVSRITESKGVRLILDALNRKSSEDISCTFFGPCDIQWKNAISSNSYCEYGGYLDFYSNPEESYFKLSLFDVMLFPTNWHGEGFPGVFLDAFMVGLPVICSDWNMNSEVIQDGYNGLVLKETNVHNILAAVNKLYHDRELLNNLSINSFNSFDQYDVENAKGRINKILMSC